MKTSDQRRVKADNPHAKPEVGRGQAPAQKTTNRISGQCLKPEGDFVVKSVGKVSPSRSAEAFCHLMAENKCKSITKIKLQLFPIDEHTRIGLEKDGYHPYLELTLSIRKKISSVLKHLNSKWSSSSIVLGKPVLFPFHASGDLASCIWTLNDTHICAGDIYAAIGSPSVFRLRYGWSKSFHLPATGPPSEAKITNSVKGKISVKGKQIEMPSEKCETVVVAGATDKHSSAADQHQGNEISVDVVGQQPSVFWDNNLTNISIGGLLSEASLPGSLPKRNPKSKGRTGDQPSQSTSDSFDVFITAEENCSIVPIPSLCGSSLSILDAEDTCHPFSFLRSSSSGKGTLTVGANPMSGELQEHQCKMSETDLSLRSQVYNDERSLGLSGIKWTESLGPYFGLSSSRKINTDDSQNLGRIINQQHF